MQSAEQMSAMDRYRETFEKLTHRKISQDKFGAGESFLPSWIYVDFLESALFKLEQKNIHLRSEK